MQLILPIFSGSPWAGHSSAKRESTETLSINEDHNSQARSRLDSTTSKRNLGNVTFKGKTLTELKQEFEQKCAEIDQDHPELSRKEGNRWDALHEILKDRDAKSIRNHYENIDTLLVFAGLYSAILTAFVVEAYKLLQRDSPDASLQVLIQISHQLGGFVINSGFANATHVPPSLPIGPFIPEPSSVWLNGLWFVALILSLVTASLGMLVKQWLREYLNLPDVTPEAHRRIQLFRIRGLRKYKVSEIAALLPLLLQISLILFFAGLVIFTRSIHATISWVITGFVVAWGVFLIITTILPWFSASCPYKTPFLKPIIIQSKRLLNYLYKLLETLAKKIRFYWLYDKLPIQLFSDDAETRASKDSLLDTDVLVDAYKTSGNANVWEMVMHCAVDPQDPSASLTRLPSVINRRHFPSESSKTLTEDVWHTLSWDEKQLFVKSLAICLRLRLVQAFEKQENSELDDDVVDSLLQLDEYAGYVRRGSNLDRALGQLSSALLQGALSVPFAPESLVKYVSKLLEGYDPIYRRWEYVGSSAMTAFIKASNQALEEPDISNDGDEVLVQCERILFCAARSTEESQPVLEHEFPRLSHRIASNVESLPYPSVPQYPDDVVRWHCILDMAIRLHKRIPGIIDKTLFEALHAYSVKMFDLYVDHWEDGEFGKYVEGKPEGIPQTSDASIGPIDWDQVLDDYAEVKIRDVGEFTEYGDKWDYKRLRVDYKHRMEFVLNYEKCGMEGYGDEIREAMNESRL